MLYPRTPTLQVPQEEGESPHLPQESPLLEDSALLFQYSASFCKGWAVAPSPPGYIVAMVTASAEAAGPRHNLPELVVWKGSRHRGAGHHSL